MSTRGFALMIAFRRGWQQPFGEGDSVRIYRAGDRALLAELPAHVLEELLYHALLGHDVQALVAAHLSPLPPPEPLPLAKAFPPPRLPAAAGRRLRGRNAAVGQNSSRGGNTSPPDAGRVRDGALIRPTTPG